MKKLIGVEIRRYATIEVDVDSDHDIRALVLEAVKGNSASLDWNEPEVDYIEVLRDEEYETMDESPIYDRAYEERRDAAYA